MTRIEEKEVGAPIWAKFGSLIQNNVQITPNWSRSKSEIKFQYGGGLYFETGSMKIDRYMLRGVWQALNCLSIPATYCMIIAGASPGETKMWAVVRENGDFVSVVNYAIFAAIIDSFMSN